THGKTTTTTMLGEALAAAGQDPLVIVGAEVPAWGSSARIGRGGWAVVEACEAYASFEHLVPHMVVLTNLEHDHVDFYPTEQHLLDAIEGFINRIEVARS
ncbi:MAG TPA: UDP-N-acetylmuramate--L-alanine ligase, partial [Armatimonadetes bacterium]|nr:UDP-N-acetylmuramate--L-alanine ligase [Armatimonadota bacterium]